MLLWLMPFESVLSNQRLKRDACEVAIPGLWKELGILCVSCELSSPSDSGGLRISSNKDSVHELFFVAHDRRPDAKAHFF